MTTPEEEQWLEHARGGDRAAFGRLMRQHMPRVHRLAVHLTGNAGTADDVVQETFLRAWRAIGRFDGRADLFTWLYRICINVTLNLRRQNRRIATDLSDPRVPEPVAPGNPGLSAEQAQAYRTLAVAVDGLSESLRTTLVLACIEQVPYKDIARILGCSEGTVAWRVHEARRRLREVLREEDLASLDDADHGGG